MTERPIRISRGNGMAYIVADCCPHMASGRHPFYACVAGLPLPGDKVGHSVAHCDHAIAEVEREGRRYMRCAHQ